MQKMQPNRLTLLLLRPHRLQHPMLPLLLLLPQQPMPLLHLLRHPHLPSHN